MSQLDSPQLNPKQLLFIKYYLQSFNAVQSLIKAGYKTKNARSYAVQLLSKPYIQDKLNKTKQLIEKQTMVTFEKKVNYLWSMVQDESIKSDDKIKAIEVLNKMQGHNAPERHVNVHLDISDDMREAREKYLLTHEQSVQVIDRQDVQEIQDTNTSIKIDQDTNIKSENNPNQEIDPPPSRIP